MQGDALKLRLSKLKKVSVELKSKVINEPKINYQHISEIISSVLPNSSLESSLPNSHIQSASAEASAIKSKRFSSNYYPTSRFSEPSQVESLSHSIFLAPPVSNGSNYATPTISVKPALEKMLWNDRNSSNASLQSRDALDNEIDKIRGQNEQIEAQIQALYEQLQQLHKRQMIVQQQAWKQYLPFLEMQDTVEIFMTKLFVKQYDYDKIDYEQGKLQLKNDKLIISLPIKPTRSYKLSTLQQVKYIGDKNIKVDFKIDQTMYIFLQFKNSKERQQWDLALYVNHQITNNKDIDRTLFQQQKSKNQSFTPQFSKINKVKSKSSLRNTEQNANQLKLTDGRSEHLRKSSLKISDPKRIDKSVASKGSQGSSLKREQSSRHLNQVEYTLNGNNFEHNEYFLLNSIQSAQSQVQEKQFNDIIVFNNIGDSNHESRTNTSKFNNPQINFPVIEQNTPESELGPRISPQKLQEQKDALKWQASVRQLKEGYFFTKYARDGIKPHNKKLFISKSQEELICINSSDTGNQKVIPIQNIKSVKYPAIEEGIRKFLKNIHSENFCVIQYVHSGTNKVMELGCQNVKFIAKFAQQLRSFLNKKGVTLND